MCKAFVRFMRCLSGRVFHAHVLLAGSTVVITSCAAALSADVLVLFFNNNLSVVYVHSEWASFPFHEE